MVALVTIVAAILVFRFSGRQGRPTEVAPDVIANDPCGVPLSDVQPSPENEPPEAIAGIADANEGATPGPSDAQTSISTPDLSPSIRVTSNADVAPMPGGAIRGTVLRPDGTPYVEPMELTEMLRVQVRAPGYERACTIDASGRFECVGLEAGRYAVTVVDSLVPYRIPCHGIEVDVSPDAVPADVVLSLGSEATVSIEVLSDPDLQPMGRCSVVVESRQGPATATTKTDSQGLCEFNLATGLYRIYVPMWKEGQSVEVSPTLVSVKAGQPLTVQLLVPSEPPQEDRIDIVLVDSEGRPIPGFVSLEGVPADPNAEPASSFTIPEPPFHPPGGLLGSACDTSGTLGRRFIWPNDAQDDQMKVVLEPPTTVVGRVVGADRKPLSGARISLETLMLDNRWNALGDTLYTAISDAEGYFQIDGILVGPRIRTVAFFGTLSGRSRSLNLAPSEIGDVGEIVLTGGSPGTGVIQGRIIDEQDEPVANRAIKAGIARAMQRLVTAGDGSYTLTDMPTDRSVTVMIEVPMYGTWSRTTMADDLACDFQVVPQGWGAVGEEAPVLFGETWFNHAPVVLKEVRGRVVLLTFRNFSMNRDPGMTTIRSLSREFGSKGLLVIAVYDHLPGGNSVAADLITTHLTDLFEGAPIAGMLDSDPDLVADLMPPGRPPGVTAGATHWLYQVHERPASFLIDKKGIVRHCAERDSELRRLGRETAQRIACGLCQGRYRLASTCLIATAEDLESRTWL